MPIHDWSKADADVFHHFHQRWIAALTNNLNAGRLPKGFHALIEQYAESPNADILALERGPRWNDPPPSGVVLLDSPPRTRFHTRAEVEGYADRASRVAIHHPLGDVVAVTEIISPGNKSSKARSNQFLDKTTFYLRNGVHILVVDLFPPTKRDPEGIHKAIWDEIAEGPFKLPGDKPLTLACYSAGETKAACVEPVAVGDPLPDMPLFLEADRHILVPLEATYMETWDKCPEPIREAVLGALGTDRQGSR